jgi:hypothetical protein
MLSYMTTYSLLELADRAQRDGLRALETLQGYDSPSQRAACKDAFAALHELRRAVRDVLIHAPKP